MGPQRLLTFVNDIATCAQGQDNQNVAEVVQNQVNYVINWCKVYIDFVINHNKV